MAISFSSFLQLTLVLWLLASCVHCISFPDYFSKLGYINVAKNIKVSATATCGDHGREMYYPFPEMVRDIFSQQAPTAYCDQTDPTLSTAAANVIDGTESVWQSPPPSENASLTAVNLTLDLGQEYSIHFISVTMGRSLGAGTWVLERSADFGLTWTPWQYYAPDQVLCEKYFGTSVDKPSAIESVVCDKRFSGDQRMVHAQIAFSPLEGRESLQNFGQSSLLLQWTKATNIRLHLKKFWFEENPLQRKLEEFGGKYEVSPFLQKYLYYSIQEIGVWIKPECNVSSEPCDEADACCKRNLFCKCLCATDMTNCEKLCSDYYKERDQLRDNRDKS